jgi:hypothetical protein
MPKFRKKPVVIEAVQLTWPNWNAVCDFVTEPHFGGGTYVDENGVPVKDATHKLGLHINTLEGKMLANEHDWIIKGVKGEFYPCKPDIFEATYEPASI